MTPLTFKRVEIRKPRWNNYNKPTTTENGNFQMCLFVVFEVNGVEFDYMPKWSELTSIKEMSLEIERLNKMLCKEYHSDEFKINEKYVRVAGGKDIHNY